MTKDLTVGKPLKLIVMFCIPLMLGNFFQQAYNMVDTIVVGRYVGADALAAVGSVGPICFMVLGFSIGACNGFAIPMAQYFGAEDYKSMRRCIANSIYLSIAVSAVVTTVMLLVAEPLLRLINTPADIYNDALVYIKIICGGISATVLYNMLASILRAVGDSKTPLYFLIISALLNIGLDLLLVIKFSLGIKGVAIATITAQLVSGLLCLGFIRNNHYILHLQKGEMKPDLALCGKLLYSGLPMALQFSITAVGSIMLQSSINTLGSAVVAGMTAGNKLQLMLVLPSEAVGITMANFCGQNLGAKRLDRIRTGLRNGVLLQIIYSAFSMSVIGIFGKYLVMLFLDSSYTEQIGYAQTFLRIGCMFYLVLGVLFVYRNALQGMGKSVLAMFAGVLELGMRAVMGFVAVPKYGVTAACAANPMAWFIAMVFLVPVTYIVMHKLEKQASGEAQPQISADAS